MEVPTGKRGRIDGERLPRELWWVVEVAGVRTDELGKGKEMSNFRVWAEQPEEEGYQSVCWRKLERDSM